MGAICIINGFENAPSETFIHAHIERLAGNKVVLNKYYPEYTYQGKTIRYFCDTHFRLKKLRKLVPHFLYHRWVVQRELSPAVIHGCITGFVEEHEVDVFLAEYGFNGADICPHARALNIPLVVHFHGHDAHRGPEVAAYAARYRDLFGYAFRIISVSHFMTDALVRMGAPAAKIVYNPYGPREYFFDIEPDYGDTILAVGRFADIKAPYLTLMAFKLLLEECPGVKLVMVGDGPLREACISLAKAWGIETHVSFPGALRHEHTRPLFARACCFVQHSVTTSHGDAEGTPVAILEAGAAGLPVVSTRHAGIVDAVVHGKTGFLMEERDVVGMKQWMRTLVEDRELCRRMGAAARDHIRANYSIERHIACLQSVVDMAREQYRVVASPSRSRAWGAASRVRA
jgi:colanic acid/amylovoran biosynthesis glycosyltransferase